MSINDVNTIARDSSFQLSDFYEVYLEQATVLERILPIIMALNAKRRSYTLKEIHHLLIEHLNRVSSKELTPRIREVKSALSRLTEIRAILKELSGNYTFRVKAFPQTIQHWDQTTRDDELAILCEKYQDYGDLSDDEIKQKEHIL